MPREIERKIMSDIISTLLHLLKFLWEIVFGVNYLQDNSD